MPSYPIYCSSKDCKNLATYKIASKWSDGVVSELKTYGLCCEACVAKWFQVGRESFKRSRLIPNETLDQPGIYLLHRGERDQALQRLPELEVHLGASANANG